jgi:hypothetical protein
MQPHLDICSSELCLAMWSSWQNRHLFLLECNRLKTCWMSHFFHKNMPWISAHGQYLRHWSSLALVKPSPESKSVSLGLCRLNLYNTKPTATAPTVSALYIIVHFYVRPHDNTINTLQHVRLHCRVSHLYILIEVYFHIILSTSIA